MSDSGDLIPVTGEQAKAIQETAKAAQEALKVLEALGSFLKETFGTVPQDIVGLLGGDRLKVWRAENLAKTIEKAKARLKERGIKDPEPPSPSVALPILIAAAEESRDDLQDIWARLLAAAADPSRAKGFRIRFVEVVKKMDPMDALVLQAVHGHAGGRITGEARNSLAAQLHISRDEVDVSVSNLETLGLFTPSNPMVSASSAFGREFIRALSG